MTAPPKSTLTPTERRAYEAHGYFVRRQQFSAAELTSLRGAAERAIDHAADTATGGKVYYLDGKQFVDCGPSTLQFEHESGSRTIRVLEPVHLHDPSIDDLLDDPRLAKPMQALVGEADLALWTVKLNTKRAFEGSGFGWHQDSPYWMHDCNHVERLPNVMVALDDQDKNNGCFAIVPGSHKLGILPGTTDGSQLGGFFTDPSTFDAATAIHFEVPAGSLIFFHPHCVHGSGPNRSARPRRALIATYQPGGFAALKTGVVRNIRGL